MVHRSLKEGIRDQHPYVSPRVNGMALRKKMLKLLRVRPMLMELRWPQEQHFYKPPSQDADAEFCLFIPL